MTGYSSVEIWTIIALLGVGTFLIRFSFLGLLGGRMLPDWLLRHLRYTPVTVIPALMAPALLWPSDTGGAIDPPRLIAAALTIAIGMVNKGLLIPLSCGIGTYYLLDHLL